MYLPLKSTTAKATPVTVVGTLVYSGIPQMQDLPSQSWRCNPWLVQLQERFPFLFLSLTAAGAQLWFWPHLCVCTALRCLLLAQVRGSKSSGWLRHTYSLRPGKGVAATTGVWWIACSSGDWQAVATVWGTLSLLGVPPSDCEGQRSWQEGKRVVLVALPLVCHQQWQLASMVSQAFSVNFPICGAPYSCPFGLSFHSQELSPPWVHVPNPTFQHQDPFHNRRLTTQAEMFRAVVQTMQAVLTFFLPSTGHPLHSPLTCCVLLWSPKGLFLSQLISSPRGSFSKCKDLPSLSASRQGCWSLLWFLLFFSFFHPTWLWGDFSCAFRSLKSSANVQQVLWENCSICRCILHVLVRNNEFYVLLFHHHEWCIFST